MNLHKIGIMATELKPCPYCGKQAYVRYGYDEENSFVDMIYCPHCGAKSEWRTVVHPDLCCTDGGIEDTFDGIEMPIALPYDNSSDMI